MDKYPIILTSLYLTPFFKKSFKSLLNTHTHTHTNTTNSRRILKDRKQNMEDKTLA